MEAAQEYGPIQDITVPDIPADWDDAEVRSLADYYAARLIAMEPAAVLCQGEFTYTYALVERLLRSGVIVLAACSERQTAEMTDDDGKTYRESVFQFVRFRPYSKL